MGGARPYRFGVIQRCQEDVIEFGKVLVEKTKAVTSRISTCHCPQRGGSTFVLSAATSRECLCVCGDVRGTGILAIQERGWRRNKAELQRRKDAIQGMNLQARALEQSVQVANKKLKDRLRALHGVFEVRPARVPL